MKKSRRRIKSKKMEDDPIVNSLFEKLTARIDSSLQAKKSKYIMMNIPRSSLNRIIEIIMVLKLAQTSF